MSGTDIVSWKSAARENETRSSELHQWRARALLLASCGFFALFALAYWEGSSSQNSEHRYARSETYSFIWRGKPIVLAAKDSHLAGRKPEISLSRASTKGASAQKGTATETHKLAECIGHAFGHSCGGPTGHDHGWMVHEQDCVDASEHDWDYSVTNRTSTGVEIGPLVDPNSKKCLATRRAPYLGSMWLEDCNPHTRTQLWSKTVHQNHVFGFGFGESDVTEYFNAADGAAVDVNCQGKCFRQRVCLDSKLYKKWVHDSDVPSVPFPDKIPDDPLVPI
mmetsp:Transcript_13894/g.32999  ORF Transcript_13894/g.32999 Transcript_13894/m.32999 type:complete len:279 (+) Transcript_13894:204-1040(+)